jgi:hypothetical protein
MVVGLMLARGLPAQDQAPDSAGPAVAAAQLAARAWLSLVDGARYGVSWDSAANLFRRAVTRSAWEDAVREARTPFNPLGNRTLLGASFQTRLPNAPPGQYVVLQYKAQSGSGKPVVETVTPMKDEDGHWRVSGYYIRRE